MKDEDILLYIIAERDSLYSDLKALHRVRVDPTVKGGEYRQILSLEGLRRRMYAHTQVMKQVNGTYQIVAHHNEKDPYFSIREWGRGASYTWDIFMKDRTQQFLQKSPTWKKVQQYDHADVWQFFTHIDYDHKKGILKGIRLKS